MKGLTLQLDTAGSPNSNAAVTGWLLPRGGWLVPVSIEGTIVIVSRSDVPPGVLLKIEPANGNHCVAACVTSCSDGVAA